jgi:hypothetical protein
MASFVSECAWQFSFVRSTEVERGRPRNIDGSALSGRKEKVDIRLQLPKSEGRPALHPDNGATKALVWGNVRPTAHTEIKHVKTENCGAFLCLYPRRKAMASLPCLLRPQCPQNSSKRTKKKFARLDSESDLNSGSGSYYSFGISQGFHHQEGSEEGSFV